MSVRTRTVSWIVALLGIPISLWAAEDPLMGTWKMKLEDGKPATRSVIRKHEPVPNGIRVIQLSRVGSDGKPLVPPPEATVKFDGKEYTYKDDPNVDAVSYERLSPYIVFVVAKKDGKVASTFVWEVSKDGKTFTRRWTHLYPPAGPSLTVEVYEKQVK